MTEQSQPDEKRFFSLKWKTLLLLSLVLAAVNGGMAGLGYLQLQQQFQAYRQENRQQQLRELHAAIKNGYRELQQIASLIPAMASGLSAPQSFSSRLAKVFEQQDVALELEWGLDSLGLYSTDNKLVISWRMIDQPAIAARLTAQVLRTESPAVLLECNPDCAQYVAVPILVGGEDQGVLLVSRSVASLVLAFREITGSDLAVLSVNHQPDASPAASRLLQPWQSSLRASSSGDRVLALLQEAAQRYSLKQISQQAVELKQGERVYQIVLVPVINSGALADPMMIVVDDITAQKQGIEQATGDSIKAGLTGLFLSELLLLLLLTTPLRRLRRLSENLPLLARSMFVEVRLRLRDNKAGLVKDEIDLVTDTAIDLSYQLEALQGEVQRRAGSLIRKSEELAHERDFVTGLLDNAQVMILTQDQHGQILMLNREAERITGYQQQVLGQQQFCDLFEREPLQTGQLCETLQQLCAGQIESFRHDGDIRSPSGMLHTISWIHSRLSSGEAETQEQLLSVGLDITEREEAQRKLSWLADHDPLTELYNRRRFQQEFKQALKLCRRYKRHGALLFFDLDNFKLVNDTSGHQVGDALLQMVAEKLRQVVRVSDVLARLGGDEFALLLPETDQHRAERVAEKIVQQLAAVELPAQGRRHRISASIGIVLFPQQGLSVQDLMANADMAMYQAKEAGRGGWHLFSVDERMREQLRERVQLQERIEHSLKHQRFLLHYQPIVKLSSGEISHYEVLLRMVGDEGELIMPGAFIPLAEESGLIHSIDRWVLRNAFAQLNLLAAAGRKVAFSINLSGRVMDNPDLHLLLKQLLAESAIEPEQLVFEVTETAALADIGAAERLMHEVRELGCKFALDDFGVGFSSFYYLKQLPVDFVKIDGAFIRQLPQNSQDRIFVKALTEVAAGLGKQTIAEFVEDQSTLDILRELGVDYAQGYYFGKPSAELQVDHPDISALG